MKNLMLIRLGLVLMLGIGISLNNKVEASPPPMGVSFQVFYNELSPFGDWIMDPTHGYVWVPNVGPEFHPYGSNGYWTMTNYGNTWVSNYSWGWAPFHYGRWFWNDYYGWSWVPGYEWGPAWVNWRTGGGYYGWAPLGPGIGINVSIGFHHNYWRFIPQRRFMHRNFYRYYVPHYNMVGIYNRTTIINNTYVYNNRTYVAGPSRREIERVTRARVPVRQINDVGSPGRTAVNSRGVNMYRPEIDNSRSANAQARPSRAISADEYRNKPEVQSRANANRSANNAMNNQRGTATQSRSNANTNRNDVVTPQQRQSQTRTAPQQRQSQTRTAPQQRQSEVRTAPQQRQSQVRTAPQQRQSQVRTAPQQRQSQVRTAPQQRQSSPKVTQQRSSNNSQRVAPARSSRTSSSPAVRSNSSSSSRSSGAVRSSSSSSSRSSGTTSRGRGNN